MLTPQRIGFLLAALLTISGIAPAQTIYEWRSNDGERNYSDMPPENVVVEETAISITPTNPAAAEAAEAAKQAQEAEQAQLNAVSNEEAAVQAQIAEKEKSQRAANCDKARQTLTRYNNSRRVYKQGENGEREWLDIDAERAKAQQAVNTWCN
jgi:hydroxylamine reductase (hybrid-cluster protein)